MTADMEIDAVIARGMAKDPDRRYQSAFVLAAATNRADENLSSSCRSRPPAWRECGQSRLWQL
ncbi:hypothetical protein ACIP5Y_42445 [Nocardia sp. NPDC088792]|uniref:hypothetical protein n=1 Tax=Nocardia sp. NPDC088792 TaxID=3364332 RepID=UPI003818667D